MTRILFALILTAGTLSAQTPRAPRTAYRDDIFVRNFSHNVQYNIELANSFVTRTPNRELREVALRNAVDQNALRIHLGVATNGSRSVIAPVMSREERRDLSDIRKLKGPAFDQAYSRQAGKNNANVIAEVQRAAVQSGSPAIRNFASNALPVVEENKAILKAQR